MKRRISILFLFIANIVLLGHAVVPYHNHVLFLNSYPETVHLHDDFHICGQFENIAKHGELGECSHANADLKDCQLDKIYVRAQDDSRIFKSQNDQFIDSSLFPFLFILTDYTIQLDSDLAFSTFRQKPYLESFYSIQFSQSKGLRAPPANI